MERSTKGLKRQVMTHEEETARAVAEHKQAAPPTAAFHRASECKAFMSQTNVESASCSSEQKLEGHETASGTNRIQPPGWKCWQQTLEGAEPLQQTTTTVPARANHRLQGTVHFDRGQFTGRAGQFVRLQCKDDRRGSRPYTIAHVHHDAERGGGHLVLQVACKQLDDPECFTTQLWNNARADPTRRKTIMVGMPLLSAPALVAAEAFDHTIMFSGDTAMSVVFPVFEALLRNHSSHRSLGGSCGCFSEAIALWKLSATQNMMTPCSYL